MLWSRGVVTAHLGLFFNLFAQRNFIQKLNKILKSKSLMIPLKLKVYVQIIIMKKKTVMK